MNAGRRRKVEILTTTDLKALRLLLGLSPSEAAAMIDEPKDWLVDAERGRSWNISPKYRDFLLRMEEVVQTFIDWVETTPGRFIIVYSNEDVFRDYDPVWSAKFPTALMHLQAASRAVSTLGNRRLNIVTLFPKAFEEYLQHTGKADSPDVRQSWAEAFSANYRTMEAKP